MFYEVFAMCLDVFDILFDVALDVGGQKKWIE